MMNREQALVEGEWKLQVANRAVPLAQRSALSRAERAYKYFEELDNANERLKATHSALKKERDDTKTAGV